MNENRINIAGSYHRPFFFPFASVYVPVVPCVLDGSLSLLESIWKVMKNLNELNGAVNANHTDILTLSGVLEDVITELNGKLDFLEVNFTGEDPITADKTYTEITDAFEDKLVIGRYNDQLYLLMAYDETTRPAPLLFYSLHGSVLDIISYGHAAITKTSLAVITSAGGTVTGELNVAAPTQDANAATKKYVDDQDAETLAAAKTYADQTFVKTNGDSGSTYATRNATEQDFTDIPSSTLTLNNLYAKLGRWYSEIANRVTVADVVDSSGTLRCTKTFAVLKDMIDAGHEVIVHYEDGALATLKTNVARVDTYNNTKITFWCSGYTITVNSDESVTAVAN